MKLDTLVALVKQLRDGQVSDDTDPNNVLLQTYTNPVDTLTASDAVRTLKSTTRVWGNGTTYTATDSAGQSYQAPSCGWYWSSGGKWG